MINLEKGAKEVKVFAPKQIETKVEVFYIQGTKTFNEEDGWIDKIQLRMHGEGLIDLIVKNIGVPMESLSIETENGIDFLVLNSMVDDFYYQFEQVNINYVRVTATWTRLTWECESLKSDNRRLSSEPRKKKSNR